MFYSRVLECLKLESTGKKTLQGLKVSKTRGDGDKIGTVLIWEDEGGEKQRLILAGYPVESIKRIPRTGSAYPLLENNQISVFSPRGDKLAVLAPFQASAPQDIRIPTTPEEFQAIVDSGHPNVRTISGEKYLILNERENIGIGLMVLHPTEGLLFRGSTFKKDKKFINDLMRPSEERFLKTTQGFSETQVLSGRDYTRKFSRKNGGKDHNPIFYKLENALAFPDVGIKGNELVGVLDGKEFRFFIPKPPESKKSPTEDLSRHILSHHPLDTKVIDGDVYAMFVEPVYRTGTEINFVVFYRIRNGVEEVAVVPWIGDEEQVLKEVRKGRMEKSNYDVSRMGRQMIDYWYGRIDKPNSSSLSRLKEMKWTPVNNGIAEISIGKEAVIEGNEIVYKSAGIGERRLYLPSHFPSPLVPTTAVEFNTMVHENAPGIFYIEDKPYLLLMDQGEEPVKHFGLMTLNQKKELGFDMYEINAEPLREFYENLEIVSQSDQERRVIAGIEVTKIEMGGELATKLAWRHPTKGHIVRVKFLPKSVNDWKRTEKTQADGKKVKLTLKKGRIQIIDQADKSVIATLSPPRPLVSASAPQPPSSSAPQQLSAEWLLDLARTQPDDPDLRIIDGDPYLIFFQEGDFVDLPILVRVKDGKLQISYPLHHYFKYSDSSTHQIKETVQESIESLSELQQTLLHGYTGAEKLVENIIWLDFDETGRVKDPYDLPNMGDVYIEGFDLIVGEGADFDNIRFMRPSKLPISVGWFHLQFITKGPGVVYLEPEKADPEYFNEDPIIVFESGDQIALLGWNGEKDFSLVFIEQKSHLELALRQYAVREDRKLILPDQYLTELEEAEEIYITKDFRLIDGVSLSEDGQQIIIQRNGKEEIYHVLGSQVTPKPQNAQTSQQGIITVEWLKEFFETQPDHPDIRRIDGKEYLYMDQVTGMQDTFALLSVSGSTLEIIGSRKENEVIGTEREALDSIMPNREIRRISDRLAVDANKIVSKIISGKKVNKKEFDKWMGWMDTGLVMVTSFHDGNRARHVQSNRRSTMTFEIIDNYQIRFGVAGSNKWETLAAPNLNIESPHPLTPSPPQHLSAEWLLDLARTQPDHPDLRMIDGDPYLFFEEQGNSVEFASFVRVHQGKLQIIVVSPDSEETRRVIASFEEDGFPEKARTFQTVTDRITTIIEAFKTGPREVSAEVATSLKKMPWNTFGPDGKTQDIIVSDVLPKSHAEIRGFDVVHITKRRNEPDEEYVMTIPSRAPINVQWLKNLVEKGESVSLAIKDEKAISQGFQLAHPVAVFESGEKMVLLSSMGVGSEGSQELTLLFLDPNTPLTQQLRKASLTPPSDPTRPRARKVDVALDELKVLLDPKNRFVLTKGGMPIAVNEQGTEITINGREIVVKRNGEEDVYHISGTRITPQWFDALPEDHDDVIFVGTPEDGVKYVYFLEELPNGDLVPGLLKREGDQISYASHRNNDLLAPEGHLVQFLRHIFLSGRGDVKTITDTQNQFDLSNLEFVPFDERGFAAIGENTIYEVNGLEVRFNAEGEEVTRARLASHYLSDVLFEDIDVDRFDALGPTDNGVIYFENIVPGKKLPFEKALLLYCSRHNEAESEHFNLLVKQEKPQGLRLFHVGSEESKKLYEKILRAVEENKGGKIVVTIKKQDLLPENVRESDLLTDKRGKPKLKEIQKGGGLSVDTLTGRETPVIGGYRIRGEGVELTLYRSHLGGTAIFRTVYTVMPTQPQINEPTPVYDELPPEGIKGVVFNRIEREFSAESEGFSGYELFENKQYGLGVLVNLGQNGGFYVYSLEGAPEILEVEPAWNIISTSSVEQTTFEGNTFVSHDPEFLVSLLVYDSNDSVRIDFSRGLGDKEFETYDHTLALGQLKFEHEIVGRSQWGLFKGMMFIPYEGGHLFGVSGIGEDVKDVQIAITTENDEIKKVFFKVGGDEEQKYEAQMIDISHQIRTSMPGSQFFIATTTVGDKRFLAAIATRTDEKGLVLSDVGHIVIQEIVNVEEAESARTRKRLDSAIEALQQITYSDVSSAQAHVKGKSKAITIENPLPIRIEFPNKTYRAFGHVLDQKRKDLQVEIQIGETGTVHPYDVVYEHAGKQGVFFVPVEGGGAKEGVIEFKREGKEVELAFDPESALGRWIQFETQGPVLEVERGSIILKGSREVDSDPIDRKDLTLMTQLWELWVEGAKEAATKGIEIDVQEPVITETESEGWIRWEFKIDCDEDNPDVADAVAALLETTDELRKTSLRKKREPVWRGKVPFNYKHRGVEIIGTHTRNEEGDYIFTLQSATIDGITVNETDQFPQTMTPGEKFNLSATTETKTITAPIEFKGLDGGIQVGTKEIEKLLETTTLERTVEHPVEINGNSEVVVKIKKVVDYRAGETTYTLVEATIHGIPAVIASPEGAKQSSDEPRDDQLDRVADARDDTRVINPGQPFRFRVDHNKDHKTEGHWAWVDLVLDNLDDKDQVTLKKHDEDFRTVTSQEVRAQLVREGKVPIEDSFSVHLNVKYDPWTQERTIVGATLELNEDLSFFNHVDFEFDSTKPFEFEGEFPETKVEAGAALPPIVFNHEHLGKISFEGTINSFDAESGEVEFSITRKPMDAELSSEGVGEETPLLVSTPNGQTMVYLELQSKEVVGYQRISYNGYRYLIKENELPHWLAWMRVMGQPIDFEPMSDEEKATTNDRRALEVRFDPKGNPIFHQVDLDEHGNFKFEGFDLKGEEWATVREMLYGKMREASAGSDVGEFAFDWPERIDSDYLDIIREDVFYPDEETVRSLNLLFQDEATPFEPGEVIKLPDDEGDYTQPFSYKFRNQRNGLILEFQGVEFYGRLKPDGPGRKDMPLRFTGRQAQVFWYMEGDEANKKPLLSNYRLREIGGHPQLYALGQPHEKGLEFESRQIHLAFRDFVGTSTVKGVRPGSSDKKETIRSGYFITLVDVAADMPGDRDSEPTRDDKAQIKREKIAAARKHLGSELKQILKGDDIPVPVVYHAEKVFGEGDIINFRFLTRKKGQPQIYELRNLRVDKENHVLIVKDIKFIRWAFSTEAEAEKIEIIKIEVTGRLKNRLILTTREETGEVRYVLDIAAGELKRQAVGTVKEASDDEVADLLRESGLDKSFEGWTIKKFQTNLVKNRAASPLLLLDPDGKPVTAGKIDAADQGYQIPEKVSEVTILKTIKKALEDGEFHGSSFRPAREALVEQLLTGGKKVELVFVNEKGIIIIINMMVKEDHHRDSYVLSQSEQDAYFSRHIEMYLPPKKEGGRYREIKSSLFRATAKRTGGAFSNKIEILIQVPGEEPYVLELRQAGTTQTMKGAEKELEGMDAFTWYGVDIKKEEEENAALFANPKTKHLKANDLYRSRAQAALKSALDYHLLSRAPTVWSEKSQMLLEVNAGKNGILMSDGTVLDVSLVESDEGDFHSMEGVIVRDGEAFIRYERYTDDGSVITGEFLIKEPEKEINGNHEEISAAHYSLLTDMQTEEKWIMVGTRQGELKLWAVRKDVAEFLQPRIPGRMEMRMMAGGVYRRGEIGPSSIGRRPWTKTIDGQEIPGVQVKAVLPRGRSAAEASLDVGKAPKVPIFIYQDEGETGLDGLPELKAARGEIDPMDVMEGDYYPFGYDEITVEGDEIQVVENNDFHVEIWEDTWTDEQGNFHRGKVRIYFTNQNAEKSIDMVPYGYVVLPSREYLFGSAKHLEETKEKGKENLIYAHYHEGPNYKKSLPSENKKEGFLELKGISRLKQSTINWEERLLALREKGGLERMMELAGTDGGFGSLSTVMGVLEFLDDHREEGEDLFITVNEEGMKEYQDEVVYDLMRYGAELTTSYVSSLRRRTNTVGGASLPRTPADLSPQEPTLGAVPSIGDDEFQASSVGDHTSMGVQSGFQVFSGSEAIQADADGVLHYGMIEVLEEGGVAVESRREYSSELVSSGQDAPPTGELSAEWETILLESIALAEKRGLTEVVYYLEFASDEEAAELFMLEQDLYRNLIENGYASHASQLSQTGQKVSPHQIVMLNAALVTGSSAEVAQLVEEIAPAEVPTEMPGMTVLGAPTGSSVLKPASVLRVVR